MAIADFPQDEWTFTMMCAHKRPCSTETQDVMGFKSKSEAIDAATFGTEKVFKMSITHRPLLSGTDDWYEVFYTFDLKEGPMPIYVVFIHQFKTTVDSIHQRIAQRAADFAIVDAMNAQFSTQ